MTALKERIESRRIVNNLRKADHILYKSLFEDVEKNHRVTKALKEEKKLIEELKKTAENVYSLSFNVASEEITLLETIEKILKEFEAFSKSVGTLSKSVSTAQLKKVERDFLVAILEALKAAENEERDEYKQVMLIINEAEEKDRNKFMANIRLAFKKETTQSVLEKFAARAEIRKAKTDISELQKIPMQIKAMRTRFTKKSEKGTVEKIIGQLAGTTQKIRKCCKDAFYELFWIMKRDTLWALKLLYDLNNLKEFNEKWRGKSWMPAAPVIDKNNEVDKLELKISHEFHIIAQAFRIIITKIQQIEKEAEVDYSKG